MTTTSVAVGFRTGPKSARGRSTMITLYAVNILLFVLIGFIDLPRELLGILVIVFMVTLMLLGVPIAFGMLGASMVGLWKLAGYAPLASTLKETVFNSAASWSLSVIPSFILMGVVMWKAGITDRLFDMVRAWLGWLPGGLAVSSNFAGAGLAAVSGSTVSVTYALGKVALPSMIKAGYAPGLATGTVSAVGTLGQLIPPSILLVVYAGVAQTSVGPQLLAPVVPAIILAVGYGLMIVIRAWVNPSLAPRGEVRFTWSERLRSLSALVPIAIVFGGVIGGMLLGLFTPTEAAAFGVVAALLVAWLFSPEIRRSPRKLLPLIKTGVVEAVSATATIFLLLVGVYVLTRVITMSRLSVAFADWVVAMDLGRIEFLLILVVIYLILGTALDPLAMILLTVPILAGPLEMVGVDLIWFGVFVLVLGEIAQISPPIGLMSFIVHRIVQDPEVNEGRPISLGTVFKGALWFIVVSLLLLVLLIVWPDLALWLPENATTK